MCGTLSKIGIQSDSGPYVTTIPPLDQPIPLKGTSPQGGFRIDPGLYELPTRVPAAFREDSCPQAILKFQPYNTFDYWVRYKPQLFLGVVLY